jgi:hypothetical protein
MTPTKCAASWDLAQCAGQARKVATVPRRQPFRAYERLPLDSHRRGVVDCRSKYG